MLLWGLQRYYLSPHTPRDAAVGFTKVLPLPTHPKGCCCEVYKGTTSPHTPQGMLLWGLQRYYLSPDTPYIPRDASLRFTKVLPLPRHPLHPKGCCCRVYKGTTSPQTPQGMLLWGLQRYYLSPDSLYIPGMLLSGLQKYYLSPDTLYTPRDAAVGFTKVLPVPTYTKGCCGVYKSTTSPHTPYTPRDAAVGFTKVLPLPTHPKGCFCGVYKGTTCPHTPQGMLLWGLQRYYLSPHTPRNAAVGFTKVLPLPTYPKGCFCGVYKGTTSPHTPQGILLWGLQRYYLSPDTPDTPRDAAVGFTKVLPLPTHPKGYCCGVYKGTTCPQTHCTSQGMLLWGLQRYYLSPHTPRDAAVGFTKVLPVPTHPKGCCCGVYKGTTCPQTPQGMLLWGLQRYYLSPDTPDTPRDAAVGFTKVLPVPTHPKGCCCGVYKGATSPHIPYIPRDAAVGFTKVLPLPTHPAHPKGCCCQVYKGTTSPQTPCTLQWVHEWGHCRERMFLVVAERGGG